MPVFEGLLPDKHDKIVQDLLYTLAMWHGLAKLRLHTDPTLNYLSIVTKNLGHLLRRFSKYVCGDYATTELPRETAARGRRKAAAAAKGKGKGKAADGNTPNKKSKLFNLATFKLHSLADYVYMIRRFGTSDSYSTQTVRFFQLGSLHVTEVRTG